MRLHVRHVTEYRYSAPVRLGRHRLRLTPRDDAGVLLARVLDVSPHPVDQTVVSDTGGNVLTLLDFLGETDHLRIDSSFHIDIPPPPSIPRNLRPLPWPDSEIGPPPSRRVFEFASDLAAMQGQDVPSFLDELNDMLFTRFDRQIRDEGDAQSPDETLTRGVGACRDLAVLFMAAARSQGLLARFASGYQARSDSADGRRHLHAWPEVFLPGSGWRGYDPTHGTHVTDGHVAVAVAIDQAGTMPVEGGFWGDGVTSSLSYEIEIEAL